MSTTMIFPAAGITQLILEEIARDGVVRGDAPEIQVTCDTSGQDAPPAFVSEGTTVRFTGAAASRIGLPAGVGLSAGTAQGDLRVQGVTGAVQLEAVRGDLRLDALPTAVTVSQVDGNVRAAGIGNLRLSGVCHGDLRFDAGGDLTAATVRGDLRLSDAGEIALGHINGDIFIEKVSGVFRAERVDGDARLNGIGGMLSIGRLAGDLRAAGLAGGLAAQVNGDVALAGPFAAPGGYLLSTEGDVSCELPADADVRLTVNAQGRVRSDIPLTPTGDGAPSFTATIGMGTVSVTFNVAGDARISQAGAAGASKSYERRGRSRSADFADPGNLGDRIRQQVMASLASAGISLETGNVRGFKAPRPPVPPERPKSPGGATTVEQMTILKMVEDGKITPEEADVLLKTLGA